MWFVYMIDWQSAKDKCDFAVYTPANDFAFTNVSLDVFDPNTLNVMNGFVGAFDQFANSIVTAFLGT
jgi:hypothetical protein